MITRMEVVILVGLPGSGKTSFFQSRFAASHAHVSKDLLPNARDKGARQIAQDKVVDKAAFFRQHLLEPSIDRRCALVG